MLVHNETRDAQVELQRHVQAFVLEAAPVLHDRAAASVLPAAGRTLPEAEQVQLEPEAPIHVHPEAGALPVHPEAGMPLEGAGHSASVVHAGLSMLLCVHAVVPNRLCPLQTQCGVLSIREEALVPAVKEAKRSGIAQADPGSFSSPR